RGVHNIIDVRPRYQKSLIHKGGFLATKNNYPMLAAITNWRLFSTDLSGDISISGLTPMAAMAKEDCMDCPGFCPPSSSRAALVAVRDSPMGVTLLGADA